MNAMMHALEPLGVRELDMPATSDRIWRAMREARAASYRAQLAGRHQVQTLRTGAEYRKALRDGRKVWVVGEGAVDDVTTHPATRAMVDEYVAWYDRHFDPAWQDVVLTPRHAGQAPAMGLRAAEERR